jgi:hypothetical protein
VKGCGQPLGLDRCFQTVRLGNGRQEIRGGGGNVAGSPHTVSFSEGGVLAERYRPRH